MPDQLSLRLDAGMPKPASTLRPMLERPLAEPFDSPTHLFEPMWGGVRALAVIGPSPEPGGGEVTFVRDDGIELSPTPIDLAGLAARIAARSAVLDGELVVVDAEGRLDREELDRRLAGERGRPLAYLAFDLLEVDGRPQLSLPLTRRRELLRRLLRPGDELVAVPAILEEGRALYQAVAAQGLAGIRARQAASPYLPGVRSRLWRSIAIQPGKRTARRSREAPGDADGSPIAADGGRAPVLSLIARLPLGLDDDGPTTS
jgi:bifunctional non-homologous end joining protein LigD